MERFLQISLFEGCGRRERSVLRRLGTTVTVEAERRLSTQGDAGRQFAIVLDGELEVVRDERVVATLHAGDCVGEIALLTGPRTPATATVEARTTTTVWVLSSKEFDDMVRELPRVADRLSHIGLTRAVSNMADRN